MTAQSFPELMKARQAEARRNAEAARPPRQSSAPASGSARQRYAGATLAAVLKELSEAKEGSRNDTLNRCAFRLYQLVEHDLLDEQGVTAGLRHAATVLGLPEHEIQGTLASARGAAQGDPGPAPNIKGGTLQAVPLQPFETGRRQVRLTPASSIKVRPVRWLWQGRIACGTLALVAGREGVSKTTVACQLAADITRGQLAGAHHGRPRGVVIAATEDSWEHTLVPRLMAAGADLERIFRVDVTTSEGSPAEVNLPADIPKLGQLIRDHDIALILLDPLMSRLDARLDTHKDSEVRQALEPLVKMAGDTDAALLGLIHLNKSSSTDPLNTVMASRAFTAVARAVLYVMRDPDDEDIRLLGQVKNNLGRSDLPTLTYRVDSAVVAHTDEGPVETGKVVWLGEAARSIQDAVEASHDAGDVRTAVTDAAGWLTDYLTAEGGTAESAAIRDEGRKAGHSIDALKRARQRIRATSTSSGFPRRTYWTLPSQSAQASQCNVGESAPTALTALTEAVGAVSAVSEHHRTPAPTAPPDPSCAVCGQRLVVVEPGQTTHPTCAP